ncbi:MAG: APC family permease [Myxococcales bacterium]|nr:APC family permease [Myxococcales bacterium]
MSESPAPARRSLGFGSLLALGVNGIVGVGIFFAPAEVAGLVPGTAGVWVYALTALCLLPVALAYAALGSRFAEDGGPYVWARAAFGPSTGFAVGWVAYVSALFSTSAVMAGLSQHAGPLLGFDGVVGQRVFAALSVLVLAGTAASGLRPSAWVWSGITVLKLVPLLLLASLFFAAPKDLPTPSVVPGADFARGVGGGVRDAGVRDSAGAGRQCPRGRPRDPRGDGALADARGGALRALARRVRGGGAGARDQQGAAGRAGLGARRRAGGVRGGARHERLGTRHRLRHVRDDAALPRDARPPRRARQLDRARRRPAGAAARALDHRRAGAGVRALWATDAAVRAVERGGARSIRHELGFAGEALPGGGAWALASARLARSPGPGRGLAGRPGRALGRAGGRRRGAAGRRLAALVSPGFPLGGGRTARLVSSRGEPGRPATSRWPVAGLGVDYRPLEAPGSHGRRGRRTSLRRTLELSGGVRCRSRASG